MSRETDMTIEYYNQHADEYVDDTLYADMSDARNKFLSYVPEGGTILDFGCGSGRDSKAFLNAGYQVVPLDGSPALCDSAQQLLDQPIICCNFQDYLATTHFDGIWACASLLHLKEDELSPVLVQLIKSLKLGAPLYMSFKYGDYSGERNGRWFTDMTEKKLTNVIMTLHRVNISECWITEDVRVDRTEKWLNAICMNNMEGE